MAHMNLLKTAGLVASTCEVRLVRTTMVRVVAAKVVCRFENRVKCYKVAKLPYARCGRASLSQERLCRGHDACALPPSAALEGGDFFGTLVVVNTGTCRTGNQHARK